MLWQISNIADAVQIGLAAQVANDDIEQSVRGIDTLDEVSLHPILHSALRTAGFGVFPEERFPSDRLKKSRSEGKRCDIVLTPSGRPLASPDSAETLFDPPDAVNLGDAFWLEVKMTTQFTPEGEPNRRYSAELMAPVRRDVDKLARDPHICHAAVLLVLFVADSKVAEHDLRVWQQCCIERGYPIGSPVNREITISDRIGHQNAAISLIPVYHL